MSRNIGEVSAQSGEVQMEWRVPDFSSLTEKTNEYYNSPTFNFLDASWYMRIYPNGQSNFNSAGHFGLYLLRGDAGQEITVKFCLKLVSVEQKNSVTWAQRYTFGVKNEGWGCPKLISRPFLLARKSEFAPEDTVTIVCSVKREDPNYLEGNYPCE